MLHDAASRLHIRLVLHAVFASVCGVRVTCAVRVSRWSWLQAHGVRVSAVRLSKLWICLGVPALQRTPTRSRHKRWWPATGPEPWATWSVHFGILAGTFYHHVFRSIFAGMKLTQRRPRFYKQTHCEVESSLSEGYSKAGSKPRLTPLRNRSVHNIIECCIFLIEHPCADGVTE